MINPGVLDRVYRLVAEGKDDDAGDYLFNLIDRKKCMSRKPPLFRAGGKANKKNAAVGRWPV